MYTAQPSALRRALSLLATFRVWSFSLRSLYVAFTAPESVPPWPGSRTTFPEQGCSCALAPVVKAATESRIAARIAASTVAHILTKLAYVIPNPFRVGLSQLLSSAPRYVTAGIILAYEGLRIPPTDYLLLAAEEAGPEAAGLVGGE